MKSFITSGQQCMSSDRQFRQKHSGAIVIKMEILVLITYAQKPPLSALLTYSVGLEV